MGKHSGALSKLTEQVFKKGQHSWLLDVQGSVKSEGLDQVANLLN